MIYADNEKDIIFVLSWWLLSGENTSQNMVTRFCMLLFSDRPELDL